MAAKAGRITVDFQAGTSKFVSDIETANRSLSNFGHIGVTNVQATSAALRVLEGNITSNLRAAERFAASIPGVGAALRAAFPVVGGIALLGVLSELGKKTTEVYEAFQKVKEAPLQATNAFQALTTSIGQSNDELRVANDRLSNEIAKLQGRPQNGLKLALDEAKVSADHLAESLRTSVGEALKILKENDIGGLKAFFTNQKSTTGSTDQFRDFQLKFAEDTFKATEAIRAQTTVQGKANAEKARDAALTKDIATEIEVLNTRIRENNALVAKRAADLTITQAFPDPTRQISNLLGLSGTPDPRLELARDQAAKLSLQNLAERIPLTTENEKLKGQQTSLEASRANSRTLSPQVDRIGEEMDALRNKLQGARNEAAEVGNSLATSLSKGVTSGFEAIERLNKELARSKEEAERQAKENPALKGPADALQGALTGRQRLELLSLETQLSVTEALTEATRKLQRTKEEEANKAFEFKTKEIGLIIEQIQGTDEVSRHEQERTKSITKQVEALRTQTRIITDFQIPSVGLNRNAQREAERQATRLRVEQENPDLQESNPGLLKTLQDESVAKLNAQYKLDDDTHGVGQTAFQGFTKFFSDFEDNTKSAGVQVQTILGGAFSGLDNQLSRLITGQKASFSDFFQGIASEVAQLGLNSAFSTIFKDLNLQGSKDESTGKIGGLGGLLGILFGGFKAEGGNVSSGTTYLVGERGPELFRPTSSGSIVPNNALGGGVSNVTYNFDNRGATNSAEMEYRTRRAIEEARAQGASDGVRYSREIRRRVPNSKAFAT